MQYVPIKDKQNLIRDIESKAILATTTDAITKYNEQAKIIESAKEKTQQIEKLQKDMDEIKTLLQTLQTILIKIGVN